MVWATALFMVMAHVIKHTFRKQAQYEDCIQAFALSRWKKALRISRFLKHSWSAQYVGWWTRIIGRTDDYFNSCDLNMNSQLSHYVAWNVEWLMFSCHNQVNSTLNSSIIHRLIESFSFSLLINFSVVLRLSTFIGCQQAFDSHNNSPHGEFIKCQTWRKMLIMRQRRVGDFSCSLILPPIMKNVWRNEFGWPKILKFCYHLLSLAWSLQASTRSLCYHHYQVQICQQAVRNLMKY